MKAKTLHEDILHIWTPPPCDAPASLISWPPSSPPPPLLAAPCSSCPSPLVLSRARSSSSCRMAARLSSEVKSEVDINISYVTLLQLLMPCVDTFIRNKLIDLLIGRTRAVSYR